MFHLRAKSSLKVREHKSLGPYVENLSNLAVSSFKVSSTTNHMTCRIIVVSSKLLRVTSSLCIT